MSVLHRQQHHKGRGAQGKAACLVFSCQGGSQLKAVFCLT